MLLTLGTRVYDDLCCLTQDAGDSNIAVTTMAGCSTCNVRQNSSYVEDVEPAYPLSKPTNPLERILAWLNNETFPSSDYARVDNILVSSLFSSKRHPNTYRLQLLLLEQLYIIM